MFANRYQIGNRTSIRDAVAGGRIGLRYKLSRKYVGGPATRHRLERKMLQNVFRFIFDHLFSWDHTADILKRSLGAKCITQRMDNREYSHNQIGNQDAVQRTTPYHAAELSLKALLGPEERLWPPRPTFHKTWPVQLQAYQRVYEAIGPHFVNEWPSLDDAENRKIIDNFRARVRRELSAHIQTSAVQTLLNDEKCMSEPAWQGFYACIAYLRHYYRYLHP